MSVGVEHIVFWNAPNLKAQKVKPPSSKPGVKLGFPSVVYSQTGLALLAASDGNVYTMNGSAFGKTFK